MAEYGSRLFTIIYIILYTFLNSEWSNEIFFFAQNAHKPYDGTIYYYKLYLMCAFGIRTIKIHYYVIL